MTNHTTIWANGKAIGRVTGDVFYKRVRGSVHFLKKPPAICVDCQSLADAEDAGARHVEILDTETGRRYRASCDTIRQRGRYIDRGFGAQYALGMNHWEVDDPKVKFRQLDLFGGMLT